MFSNLIKVAPFAAAVLLLGSCDDNLPTESFQRGQHDDSGKVICTFKAIHSVLDAEGADNTWPVSAQVGIFDNTNENTSSAVYVVNGTVSSEVSSKATQFAALFPYDENATFSAKDGSITTTLSPTQSAVNNSFSSIPNISVAQTSERGGELAFCRAGAVVRFKVEDSGIASITLEGQAGEILAGKVSIKTNGSTATCTSVQNEGSTALTVLGDGQDGTFTQGGIYYAEMLPQTLASGLKITCAQGNGAIGTITLSSAVKLSTNSVYELGALHCEGYFSPFDQYNNYIKSGSITIAGKTYNYPEMPAYLVESKVALKDILNGDDKRGIYFLNSGIDFDVVDVQVTSEIVLVGRYSNARSRITYASNAYMYMFGGSLTIANMEFLAGARAGSWLGHNSKDGVVDAFIIDNCILSPISRPLWYIYTNQYSIREISITNSTLLIGPDGKNQLFNVWNSKALTGFEKFTFSNNIIYAETPQDLQIFNGNGLNSSSKPDNKNTLSNMDFVVENNIFYNLTSKTASPGLSGLLVRTYALKSLSVRGNVFAHSQTSTLLNYPFFYLYGNQDESTISGYIKSGSEGTGSNYVWDMKGNGVTNVNNTKVIFSAGYFYNTTDHPDKNPFSSIDLSTGTFVLTEDIAAKYGPRN